MKSLQGLEREINHHDMGSVNCQENDQIEYLVENNSEEIRPQKNNVMGIQILF